MERCAISRRADARSRAHPAERLRVEIVYTNRLRRLLVESVPLARRARNAHRTGTCLRRPRASLRDQTHEEYEKKKKKKKKKKPIQLVQAVKALQSHRFGASHSLAMAQHKLPSLLETRVRAIMDSARNRRPLARGAAIAGITACVMLLLCISLAQIGAARGWAGTVGGKFQWKSPGRGRWQNR